VATQTMFLQGATFLGKKGATFLEEEDQVTLGSNFPQGKLL